ncbi:MAG: RagB/SusD family nutrient uptake outer membrane protein [Bacteroidales bacterium]|nr:RagB/SusD family nutrient uptake outer membrane protein [Bacteroidales bacterium]
MKNIRNITAILLTAVACLVSSCNKWLDVNSDNEVFADDAFKEASGYRSALTGIYKMVASSSLYGQELTWGLKSSLSWNYQSGYAVPKYRVPLQKGVYEDNNTLNILESIWTKAYSAIANCNELLAKIETADPADFEYEWEKDMIMAEARGLRALLHFEMLQLFAPAPVTGYDGPAIPYVSIYPDILPTYLTVSQALDKVIEDLDYAQKTLQPIDVDEMRNKSSFVSGATRLDNMDYVLFQGVGNIRTDGGKRDNAITDGGFFAFRGYRFNYWSATGLLARAYSYKRDFATAEKYAATIIDEWVCQYQFNLCATTSVPSNVNQIDAKRRPEPILAFWNDKVTDYYASAVGTTYNRLVDPKYLFAGDETTDFRYIGLYNSTSYKYRVWDGPDASAAENATVGKYSRPLIPVMELPELYFIRAEKQIQDGDYAGAMATLKIVRDARGCTRVISADSKDAAMEILVNEAQRDFIQRGTTFTFLKKMDWPVMYNGTPAGATLPEGWYTLPIPESEKAYY